MKIQFNFNEIIEDTGLILISLFIKDKQAVMLLDSGSINNAIDINFVKEINIDIPKSIKGKLSGFNSCNEYEYSRLTINDVYFEKKIKSDICFDVLDLKNTIKTFKDDYGIGLTGILGNDFLLKNKIIIDYKNKKIIYEDNN